MIVYRQRRRSRVRKHLHVISHMCQVKGGGETRKGKGVRKSEKCDKKLANFKKDTPKVLQLRLKKMLARF